MVIYYLKFRLHKLKMVVPHLFNSLIGWDLHETRVVFYTSFFDSFDFVGKGDKRFCCPSLRDGRCTFLSFVSLGLLF